jgi:hypothetical protein
MHDGRFEYHVVGQQLVEQVQVTAFDLHAPSARLSVGSLRLLFTVSAQFGYSRFTFESPHLTA